MCIRDSTTGCDKTTPACLMAAGTVNLPAIVLSGGPMLDGYLNGKLAGTGTVLWEARRKELKPAEITNHSPWEEFYRSNVGQLETGACLEFAIKYHDVRKVVPRHSH